MKNVATTLMLLLFVMTSAAAAAPASIEGTWAARVPSPNGQVSIDVVFTFHIENSKLSGTVAAGGTTYNLVDTRIDGDALSFAVEGEPARYTGTLNGDQINMQVIFKSNENGDRTWTFTATRSASPAGVTPSPVDGEWVGEVPRGGSQYIAARFQLHVEGATLVGRVLALDDEFPVNKGTIAGSRISFTVGNTRGQYTGEVIGDTIQMKVSYDGGENGRQTLGFVLKRSPR